MAPLIALVLGTVLAHLAGAQGFTPVDSWPAAVAVGLAAMFTLTGIAHFVPKMRDAMIAIVPPRLPAPGLLVAFTGVLELLGAIGVVVPPTRVLAAACLGLLLVVMFPANVYAANQRTNPLSTPLGWRTVEQLLFLAATAIVVWG
ncbi:DoxX family protein [Mycobacteroides sp. LB1]|uniref:DoxX family protein n=1 Tax=Mycobacteroides sp. LB1 TaxID=2750814 RepID=UPI0015DE7445|nr:DoxX family protein [Mycobacteroides sp. LB1]